MSEIRLVVRELERDWSGTVHGSCADRAVAALSADPITLEELEAAVARFAKPTPPRRFFSNLQPGLCDEPHDAGRFVIDLVARMVFVESTYSSPGRKGCVAYHDGRNCTDQDLRYHLADDWLFLSDRNDWRAVAEERRCERAAKPIFDARAVFYGRPMLEFIARQAFAAFARRDDIAADTLKQIHAAWLLTPRDDLGGVCPREIALDRHGHLGWDLEDRCGQWSELGECPPGLDPSSHAYRYGGLGTHELVKYYDLVRELLWSCWEQLTEMAQSPKVGLRPASLMVGDFLTTEVPRLETIRDAWLDAPDDECHGRTPRSIIERERARLPEGMSGHDAMVDPDCPCCQMMADHPGPMFWHLDGSGMDDHFAFDIYHASREEWEAEQRRHEEHSRRFNAEWAERERLGVTGAQSDENSIWSRSFSVANTCDVPVGMRVFGVGCHLAELIVGLRADGETAAAAQPHIDQINRDFGNLREIVQSSDASLAEALIDPVRDRFAETLAGVATARPDLAPQCEALTNEIRELLDEPPPAPTWDADDADVPF